MPSPKQSPRGRRRRLTDFVSHDPEQAAVDCEVISTQIIPQNTSSKDPFWENRARDFLWAFSLAVALSEPPERRNLATVMEMLALPVNFPDGAQDKAYCRSPTLAMLARLRRLAAEFDMPALGQTAVAIESGLGSRTDSVFDTARRFCRFSRVRHGSAMR